MKLPRRSAAAQKVVTLNGRVSTLPARSFAPETSKLLLKLLTIRRSQIKIRAFFAEVEMRASSGIVRIYCQLNARGFCKRKKRDARANSSYPGRASSAAPRARAGASVSLRRYKHV